MDSKSARVARSEFTMNGDGAADQSFSFGGNIAYHSLRPSEVAEGTRGGRWMGEPRPLLPLRLILAA